MQTTCTFSVPKSALKYNFVFVTEYYYHLANMCHEFNKQLVNILSERRLTRVVRVSS